MILKARAVKKSRKTLCYCDWCEKWIGGPHLYLVGMSDGDFVVVRYHLHCWKDGKTDLSDKEKAAFEKCEAMLREVVDGKKIDTGTTVR